jgi:hypothetical protein
VSTTIVTARLFLLLRKTNIANASRDTFRSNPGNLHDITAVMHKLWTSKLWSHFEQAHIPLRCAAIQFGFAGLHYLTTRQYSNGFANSKYKQCCRLRMKLAVAGLGEIPLTGQKRNNLGE